MIFSNLLYIFQSEHYDRVRFLQFAYKNIFSWHKLSDRGDIEWTSRAKILIILSFALWIFSLFFTWFQSGDIKFLFINIIGGIFLFPVLIILADIIISPLVRFQKNKILQHAHSLLKEIKQDKSKKLQVIGITGSYGKTSLKNILETILKTQFEVLSIPGNINTDLGVANYIISHQIEIEYLDFLIVEMGAYTTGEIQSICDIVHPEYSFLTAIAPVHLERFGSIEITAQSKFELPNFTQKKTYLNGKDLNIQRFFSRNFTGKGEVFFNKTPSSLFSHKFFLPDFSGISFDYKKKTYTTRLIAEYIFEFLEIVFPFCEEIGLSHTNLEKGIHTLEYTPHRLQVIQNLHTGVTVIDDSYNGNFSGFKAGIEVLSRAKGRRVVLTPGIVELGDLQEKIHQDLAQIYRENNNYVLLIDNSNTKIIQAEFSAHHFSNYKVYKTVHEAHSDLGRILKKGDTILFQNDLSDNYT